MIYLLLILLLSGCSTEFNKKGLANYGQRMAGTTIIAMGQKANKEEYRQDPSMGFEEYRQNKIELNALKRDSADVPILSNPYWCLNDDGKLSIDIYGQRNGELHEYGLFRTKKPLRVKYGANINGIGKFGIEIEQTELEFRIKGFDKPEYWIALKVPF